MERMKLWKGKKKKIKKKIRIFYECQFLRINNYYYLEKQMDQFIYLLIQKEKENQTKINKEKIKQKGK